MKTIIFTFGSGLLWEAHCLTEPLWKAYAARNDFAFDTYGIKQTGGEAQWTKLRYAQALLTRYDRVIWADADCFPTTLLLPSLMDLEDGCWFGVPLGKEEDGCRELSMGVFIMQGPQALAHVSTAIDQPIWRRRQCPEQRAMANTIGIPFKGHRPKAMSEAWLKTRGVQVLPDEFLWDYCRPGSMDDALIYHAYGEPSNKADKLRFAIADASERNLVP